MIAETSVGTFQIYTNSSCFTCGKVPIKTDEKLKRCGACHIARYCNVTCQKKHWNTHKIECKTAKQNETSSSGSDQVSEMSSDSAVSIVDEILKMSLSSSSSSIDRFLLNASSEMYKTNAVWTNKKDKEELRLDEILKTGLINSVIVDNAVLDNVKEYQRLVPICEQCSDYQREELYGPDLDTIIYRINLVLMGNQSHAYSYNRRYLSTADLLKYIELSSLQPRL